MRYKLICADIDGTLVDTYGRVTKDNQEAIYRLKEQGVMFAICSGRLYHAASMIGLFYDIPSYVVCSCGAVIANMEGDEILKTFPLDRKKILAIADIADKYQCVVGLNTLEGVIFRGSDGTEDVLYEEANRMYGEQTGRCINIEQRKDYRERTENEHIFKLSLWARSERDYQSLCDEIRQIPGIEMTSAMQWHLEITEANVTKWKGVKWMMERFGIEREEVVCIGDSMNDYEMVKHAGLGVAMANGDERLKEVADYVTESNNDSGVARLIELCLEGKL